MRCQIKITKNYLLTAKAADLWGSRFCKLLGEVWRICRWKFWLFLCHRRGVCTWPGPTCPGGPCPSSWRWRRRSRGRCRCKWWQRCGRRRTFCRHATGNEEELNLRKKYKFKYFFSVRDGHLVMVKAFLRRLCKIYLKKNFLSKSLQKKIEFWRQNFILLNRCKVLKVQMIFLT